MLWGRHFFFMLFWTLILKSLITTVSQASDGQHLLEGFEIIPPSTSPSEKTTSLESSPEPKPTWEYLCRDLLNFLQMPYGSGMTARGLGDHLQKIWHGDATLATQALYFALPAHQDKIPRYITKPGHDLDNDVSMADACAAGQHSILTIINTLLDYISDRKFIAYIPVAQAQWVFGMWKRQHFTLLKLIYKEGAITLNHFDAKGSMSSLYLLTQLKQNLRGIIKQDCIFKPYYLGHQGLLNANDCGRFIAGYIVADYRGHPPHQFKYL